MGFDNQYAHTSQPMPYVVLDIETVPAVGCESFIDLSEIKAPSNYKDEQKIAAYIDNAKRKAVDNAGLDLDLCEVACIGWELPDGTGAVMPRNLYPEDVILRRFWQAIGEAQLVGFNVWGFDLPVLVRRSQYLGIPMPSFRLETRWPVVRVIDLQYTLSFGRKELIRSLDFYCKRFGIQHDDTVKGEDVARLVAAGKWDQVIAHCYADVFSTHALAKRLGLVRQAVAA
jgi:predicted PolB exonuclease-like 3'-5' exonuclease